MLCKSVNPFGSYAPFCNRQLRLPCPTLARWHEHTHKHTLDFYATVQPPRVKTGRQRVGNLCGPTDGAKYLSILKCLKRRIILAMTSRIIQFKVFDWIQACQATSPGCNLLLYVCLMLNLFLIQAKSMADILRQNVEKDREIASLKTELAKLPQKSPVQPRTKRSLLANIREAVTSPRKSTTGRTLRKTVKMQHH